MIDKVKQVTDRISLFLFRTEFKIRVEEDNKFGGRVFIQITYQAPCAKTGSIEEWHGRKFYLSEHMTEDEIIKTCYAAFKAACEHEVMEAFKVDGITLFNPHVNYQELLNISHKEVKRS